MILKVLFWICLFIILYAYVGYTLLLLLISGFKKKGKNKAAKEDEPAVTLMIPAYNEGDYVIAKVHNSLELKYPKEKLKILWVTDGTTDNTADLLSRYPGIMVLHEKVRKGKINAMNRGMQIVDTPLVVFTDANTMLNPDALKEITGYFADESTGCVTGEKRINASGWQKAVGAGEGLYWKYESLVKKLESDACSVMGAVGELFAIRTKLYEKVREDTLLDDFTVSMKILQKGYDIKYAPQAWATETASLNIAEEVKRKIRIAAGGLQAFTRMTGLLNPFRYGLVSLMYVSHKVLRWTLVPFAFPLTFLLNLAILFLPGPGRIYYVFFGLQCLYYLAVMAGGILHNVKLSMKALFAPYYLFVMNYAVIRGFFRFLVGHYSVNWQKIKRS